MSGLEFKIKSNFDKEATVYYRGKFVEYLEKAHKKVADAILNDVFNQEPTPPKDTGELRESFFAFVLGKLYKKGSSYNGVSKIDRKGLVVGFSTDYAWLQHENLTPAGERWNLGPVSLTVSPGAGGKFLSSKLETNKEKYKKIIIDELGKMNL